MVMPSSCPPLCPSTVEIGLLLTVGAGLALREIVISHNDVVLSFDALAFIMSIFCSDKLNDSRVTFVARFVERHRKPDLLSSLWGSRPLHNDWRFNIQFCLRGCDALVRRDDDSTPGFDGKRRNNKTQDGLWIHRETGFIQGSAGKSATFTENRICCAILGYEFGSNKSTYTLLALSDAASHPLWDNMGVEASDWTNYGLTPSVTDPAVDHFLATACKAVERWERLWNAALGQLDEVLRVRVCTLPCPVLPSPTTSAFPSIIS